MAIRENKVERYLSDKVQYLGLGLTRAWKKSNVDGVMDQILFLSWGVQHFVEVKTTDGELSSPQVREADRLRKTGAVVSCVYGHEGVDQYINDLVDLRLNKPIIIREKYR